MNNYITQEVMNGSFHFPVSLKFHGKTRQINRATYDTGCGHSFISYNLICNEEYQKIMRIPDEQKRDLEKQNYIRRLKINDILDPNIELAFSFGVESQSDKVQQEARLLRGYIYKINQIKKNGRLNHKPIQTIKGEIKEFITRELLERILNNKNIKYTHNVVNYEIAGMAIGDTVVQISYDHENVALIGMHIIKHLNTRVFPAGFGCCMVATTGSEEELESIVYEIEAENDREIDFSVQDYEANYINRLIGSVKYFVFLVKNNSFLVRIQI